MKYFILLTFLWPTFASAVSCPLTHSQKLSIDLTKLNEKTSYVVSGVSDQFSTQKFEQLQQENPSLELSLENIQPVGESVASTIRISGPQGEVVRMILSLGRDDNPLGFREIRLEGQTKSQGPENLAAVPTEGPPLQPGDQRLFLKIENSSIDARSQKILLDNGIVFIGNLIQKSPDELLQLQGFGRLSLIRVALYLGRIKLRFNMDLPKDWESMAPPELQVQEADLNLVQLVRARFLDSKDPRLNQEIPYRFNRKKIRRYLPQFRGGSLNIGEFLQIEPHIDVPIFSSWYGRLRLNFAQQGIIMPTDEEIVPPEWIAPAKH